VVSDTDAVVLINLFEVPAAQDEKFIKAWERARDFLNSQNGYRWTQLHRSLGQDVEFRFVNVAEWRSAAAFQAATSQPDFPGREMPFSAHPGLYQVIAEDRPPEENPDGVVLINAFEVPADGDDAFLAGWEASRQFLRTQPGYLATRLHRSLSPQAEFRFVNIGRYASPQAFQAAVQQPEFRQAAAAIQHRAHPSLYEVVRR
jgi:heme-degrading monooxygenase HmoA